LNFYVLFIDFAGREPENTHKPLFMTAVQGEEKPMYDTKPCRRLLRRTSVFAAVALTAAAGFATAPVISGVAATAAADQLPKAPGVRHSGALAASGSLCGAYASALFGPNVCVFTPPSGPNAGTELAAIQTVLNNIATQQVPLSAQFNDDGYALLFEPGTYGSAATPLVFQVGYYTEVAGLGTVPQDTVINGQIDVFPNALDSEPGPGNCFVESGQTCYWANSTVNFWRSLSNLDLNVETLAKPAYAPTPLPMQAPIGNTGANGCWQATGPLGTNTDFWSVSQATPVRSVIINGNLNFQAYCSETNYQSNDFASGSYVANSEILGQLDWSGNQQGVARNTDMESAAGYVWNYVYSGDTCPPGYTPTTTHGAPGPAACSPTEDVFDGTFRVTNGTDGVIGVDQVTALAQSPVTEEEPFLYATTSTATTMPGAPGGVSGAPSEAGGVSGVFVPAVQHDSVGPNFLSGTEAGSPVPITQFFVANPSTQEALIQAALDRGQDLVLTPGVYELDTPIEVTHPNTIVIGLGFPVLVPERGNASMVVLPNNGVKLSGMIFDAGPVNSPVLLSVGSPKGPGLVNSPARVSGGGPEGRDAHSSQAPTRGAQTRAQPLDPGAPGNSASDPDLVQDIFFRIGGAETTPVSATVSLLDNADNSIIDDVWAWRADHGANASVANAEGEVGAGWTFNQGATGVLVTGSNVTAYGLAVEHYQKDEVIWSGDNGTDIFFQNELPYDPPSQTAWETSPVQPGYPAFLVPSNVQSFHGYGMGSYVVFIYSPATLWDAMAYEAPNSPGVVFTDAFDLFISSTCSVNGNCPAPSQSGGLNSVIDGVGGPATNANPTTVVDVDSYAGGAATLPSP
jgi:hypothetical protein